MTTKILLIAMLGFLPVSGLAQVGETIAHCEELLGAPLKEYDITTPKTKIFIKNNIQAQIAHESGVATGGIYHVAMIKNGKKQAISGEQLRMIYKWNGFSEQDLVATNFKQAPELNDLYRKTKNGKLLVYHDKSKNVVSITNTDALVKYIESLKKN